MPKPAQHNMLCLGDSYTIGQSVEESARFPEQTTALLAKHKIVFNQPEVIAQTGWSTQDLLNHISEKTINTHHDAVTLLIGVNDQYRGYDSTSYSTHFEALLMIAGKAAGNNWSHVFVLSIPDYSVTPFAVKSNKSLPKIAMELDGFNAINKRLTAAYGAHYVEVTTISRKAKDNPELLALDGLHPSGMMYQLWAQKLAELMVAEYQ